MDWLSEEEVRREMAATRNRASQTYGRISTSAAALEFARALAKEDSDELPSDLDLQRIARLIVGEE